MEALMGKWQVIKEETTGMEEFLKAAGVSDDVIKTYKNLDYFFETTKDGEDGFKTHIVLTGVGEHEYKWKFDQEFEYQALDGTKPKVTITKGDDGSLKESYKLEDTKREWTVTRKLEGDLMIAVTSSKKGSMTQKLKKA